MLAKSFLQLYSVMWSECLMEKEARNSHKTFRIRTSLWCFASWKIYSTERRCQKIRCDVDENKFSQCCLRRRELSSNGRVKLLVVNSHHATFTLSMLAPWFARLGSENCANAQQGDDLDALPPSRITFHNFQLSNCFDCSSDESEASFSGTFSSWEQRKFVPDSNSSPASSTPYLPSACFGSNE